MARHQLVVHAARLWLLLAEAAAQQTSRRTPAYIGPDRLPPQYDEPAPVPRHVLSLSSLPLEATFSFELGGVPSALLLANWNKTVSTFKLRGPGNRSRTRTTYFQPEGCADGSPSCPLPVHQCANAGGANYGPEPGHPDGVCPNIGCSMLGGAGCATWGLQLIIEQTHYGSVRGASAATEWTLEVRNTHPRGRSASLCAVRTLNATLPLPPEANLTVEFRDGCANVNVIHQIDSCPGGPVKPPARLITTRKLGCTSDGGCKPNQFHPQLAFFPVGSSYRLGGNIDNCTAVSCEGIGANSGHSSGPNGGLPFWSAWTTEVEGAATRYSGVTVSVGWSGFWTGMIARTNPSGLQISAGQSDFCAELPAGESFLFPRVLVVEWSGDSPQVGTNAHRRIIVDHKIPRHPETRQPLGMITNSNGMRGPGMWTNFTLASQLFHLEGVQKTGLEGLWLDASWFKQAHGFGRSGDWHIPLQSLENRSAFPGGLGVLGQAAHEPPHDTAFIVWFEPERVTGDSYLYEHFPEQQLGLEVDIGGGTIADLGNEHMRKFIVSYVNAAVEEYQLDVYRTDFNAGPLAAWRANDALYCPAPPAIARSCPAINLNPIVGLDVPKFDLCEMRMVAGATAEQCAKACCADPRCAHFVFASPNPASYLRFPFGRPLKASNENSACPGEQLCTNNTGPCCYLKAAGPSIYRKTAGDPRPGQATLRAGSVMKSETQPAFNRYCGGITENRYIRGLYQYWDEVRAAAPHLVIDNCAGGGTRVDLESMSRTTFLWRNDADNSGPVGDEAFRQQADTLGFSQFAPINSGNIKPFLLPGDGFNGSPLDPYLWRGISMTGGGIASTQEFWSWVLASQTRVTQLQNAVMERKALRVFAVEGDYWIHSPTLNGAPVDLSAVDAWVAWQLHRPIQGDGIVTLLRRPNASAAFTLHLRGICTSSDMRYNVSWANSFVVERTTVLASTELQNLLVELPPSSSVVVRYTPVGPVRPPTPTPVPPTPIGPPPPPGPVEALSFGDGNLIFAFDPVTLCVINVTSRQASRTQGFVSQIEPTSIWLLNATNCSSFLPKGSLQVDASSPCMSRSHEVVTDGDERTLVLRWLGVQGLPHATVDVNINISFSTLIQGKASFAASVGQHGNGPLCIQCLALPNLPSMFLRSPDDRFLTPEAFGFQSAPGDEFHNPSDNLNVAYGDSRPALAPNGARGTMQWTAVWSNHSASGSGKPVGLYFATHDPAGYLQLLLFHGRYPNSSDSGQPIGLRWLHLNPDLNQSAADAVYTLPYPAVIQSFAGDWYDAAQVYREWVLTEASWTRAGNLSARAGQEGPHGVASWLVNTPFWAEGAGTGAGGVASFCTSVKNSLELKSMGYFWNWWMKTTPGTPGGEVYLNPNQTAAAPAGFTSSASQMKAAGVYSFPYTEGRVMDPALPDWETDVASRYACGQSGDDVATEFYGKTTYVMDPASTYWQLKYAKYARQITTLAPGLAGVYMDQVSGACALACRGPYLGHAAGGGTSWVDGNRALFARVKEAVGAERAVVSESNAEVYLSSIDGFLSLYGWNNCGAVPAFQAVYGGWTLNIGAEYQSVMTNAAINSGNIFTDDLLSLLATQFTWGSVLGGDSLNNYYASIFFANASNNAVREYTATLAAKRLEWAEYLVHGRLMRPPTLINSSLPAGRLARPLPDPKDPNISAACPIGQPAMQLWQAYGDETGALGLVVVNYAREPVTFTASVDASELLRTNPKETPLPQTLQVQRRGDGQLQELVFGTDGVVLISKTLPPLSAALFEMQAESQH